MNKPIIDLECSSPALAGDYTNVELICLVVAVGDSPPKQIEIDGKEYPESTIRAALELFELKERTK